MAFGAAAGDGRASGGATRSATAGWGEACSNRGRLRAAGVAADLSRGRRVFFSLSRSRSRSSMSFLRARLLGAEARRARVSLASGLGDTSESADDSDDSS